MYQVYTSPKHRRHSRKFFKGVNARYRKYTWLLSGNLGMPAEFIQGMTCIFVCACGYYALFEDEEYLRL